MVKQENKKLNAALYCRVSTLEQSKGKFSSLDAQEERLKAYCIAKDWEVYNVYIDDGKTAANIDRPGLQKILEDAKSGKFQVVTATKLDRISRNVKDWHNIIQNLDTIGVDQPPMFGPPLNLGLFNLICT